MSVANQIDMNEYAAAQEHVVPYAASINDEKIGKTEVITADDDSTSVSAGTHFEVPSAEELNTLRRVYGKVPWLTYTIAFVELCERFSYYGTTAVFVNFIQQPLPDGSPTGAGFSGQSGALGQGQQASTGLTTFNSFWAYTTPLLGGWIADTYLGRYKTIMIGIACAIVGHVLIVVSAIPKVMTNPEGALGCFAVGLVIMGFGTGGFKANISPLIAEQYDDPLHVKTLSTGERVIVDPVMTVSRIYMWFYFMINIGALIGQIGMVYAEKYVGFWLAYALPTFMFCLCPIVMLIFGRMYKQKKPQGSVLSLALRAIGRCMKGRWSINPLKVWKSFHAPDFWDAAKPSMIEGPRPSWMTYDDIWVDELRRGIKACNVFMFLPLYWLSYNQMINNLTSQAATMVLDGVPNDIINNLDPIALIIFIPIVDIFVYPFLARKKVVFSPLKKIEWGFYLGCAAMIWATVTQHYIYKLGPCGYDASACDEPAPINVWSQTGAYVLIAFSEIFASITSLEYAFTKAPENMRSVVMSVNLFTTAFASAIGEAFTPLSVDPLLTWNYMVVAILAFLGGLGFYLTFRHLDKEEEKLNNLREAIPDNEANVEVASFYNNDNKESFPVKRSESN